MTSDLRGIAAREAMFLGPAYVPEDESIEFVRETCAEWKAKRPRKWGDAPAEIKASRFERNVLVAICHRPRADGVETLPCPWRLRVTVGGLEAAQNFLHAHVRFDHAEDYGNPRRWRPITKTDRK